MNELPAHLASAMRNLEEAAAHMRTQAIRASQLEVPRIELPDAAAIEQAATRPDAPDELRAVASAVRAGRVTWAEIAAGGGTDVPEVRAAYEANQQRIRHALEADEPDDSSTAPSGGARPRPEFAAEEADLDSVFRDDPW